MSSSIFVRGTLAVAAMAVASVGSAAPASAQGFFEQLFGLGRAPVYNVPPPMMAPPEFAAPPVRRKRVEQRATLQKPTDLMHDRTLQVGDAVMMKDGIHVYDGPESSRHTADQFVPLDDIDGMRKQEREKLASLDETRADPVVEQRSDSNIVSGFRITDARGASIRYVGP